MTDRGSTREPGTDPRGPLRVWADRLPDTNFDDRRQRLALNPIVRAHRDDRLATDAALRRYGSLLTHYELTGAADAEVAVLAQAYELTDPAAFRQLVSRAEKRGLRTLVFSANDLEPIMPSDSIILLHPGPTRGAQPVAHVLALPYFFTDRAHAVAARPDGPRPSVAFCGQGASRLITSLPNALARVHSRTVNRIRPKVVAPPVRGHVRIRGDALRALSQHPGIDDRFVVRDRYRAGVVGEWDRARTQREFDDNMCSATYALCVRGTGNFSARFYEALSFGRVPLFLDTECVLPLEDQIDWRAHTVWVDSTDVTSIGDQLVDAHLEVVVDPTRSSTALRRLWREQLTQDGYFGHLRSSLRTVLGG